MAYLLIQLAKRPDDTPLARYQAERLKQAQSETLPPGCTRYAHSQAVERAYRQGEPAFDVMDEHLFDELLPARAFQSQCNNAAQTMLTRMLPVKSGPAPADALKHVELVRRRAGMDRAAFLAYWRDVHGPLAASMPAVLRYRQCPVAKAEADAGARPVDGIAMLWFASMQSMREGAQHPSFARTREDMAVFMDAPGPGSVLTQERATLTR